ncbi:MAG: DMP19 family protein [Flavobacterium sp.]
MALFNLFGNKNNTAAPDPYSAFDPASHYRPKLSKGDFYRLSGFDFGWFVLEPLSDYVGTQDNEAELAAHLSPAQKALYFWWYLDAQVTNGGFIQFFFNGYGKYVPAIIAGLQLVGDDAMAERVEKAGAIYRKNIKLFENAWNDELEGLSALYDNAKVEKLNEFDDEYYDMNTATMAAIEKYIRSHAGEVAVDEEGNEFDSSYTGEVKMYYNNGNVKEFFSVSDGKISGIFSEFYEDGMPKNTAIYKEGEPTGEREDFFENGKPKMRVTKDVANGILTEEEYHENGALQSRTFRAIANGERTGLYEEWFDNGQLAETGTYKGDYERQGPWNEFYSNGNKRTEGEYGDGSYKAVNHWDEDGTQLLKDGTGLLRSSYEDDVNEHEYKNYQRHGKQHTYRNGILTLYQEMADGDEHGITRSYYDNGNLKSETVYENGVEISRQNFRIFPNPKVVASLKCEMEDEWLTNRDLVLQDSNPVLKNHSEIQQQLQAPLSIFEGYDDDQELSCNYFVTVNDLGQVMDYDFLYSDNGDLNTLTEPLLSKLEFTPGTVAGKPATTYIIVGFVFRLEDGDSII